MKTQIDLKRDPETRSDKFLELVIAYKNWIGSIVVLLAIGVLMRWIVIPLGIPSWAAIVAILSTIATPPSYMTARYLVKKFHQEDIDLVYELDASDSHIVRRYKIYQGEFPEQYLDQDEIEHQPQKWVNEMSQQCYCVLNIDHETKEAHGTWLGDYSDQEIMKFRKNWKAQRIRNSKWKRKGANFWMLEDQIVEDTSAEVTNAMARGFFQDIHLDDVTAAAERHEPGPDEDEGEDDGVNEAIDMGKYIEQSHAQQQGEKSDG